MKSLTQTLVLLLAWIGLFGIVRELVEVYFETYTNQNRLSKIVIYFVIFFVSYFIIKIYFDSHVGDSLFLD